jgi:type I restriction enzyme S subunit
MKSHCSSDHRLTPLNVGNIPDDWDALKIGQVSSCVTNGYVGAIVEHQTTDGVDKVRYLQGFNVRPNRIELLNETYVSAEFDRAHPKSRLKENDIVTVQSGHIGTTARVPKELEGSNCHALIITRPRKEIINSKYLAAYLNSHIGQARMRGLHVGSSIVHINTSELAEFRVPIPPVPEQGKIADILTTWDRAIEKLESLIEAKKRRKKALLQQLLTGRLRLTGYSASGGRTRSDRFGTYPADWRRVALGEVTEEISTRNSRSGNLPVFSCTKHRGLVLSEEYFGRRVYAEDTSSYRVVERGEFAYATNHIEEGSIGYQNLCDAGLVSPIYTVFKTSDAVDDSYLFRVLKSPLLIHLYQVNTSASVDRRGSLRYDEFSRIHIWLPSHAEQAAIAHVFDTLDQELALFRTKCAALNQQKRGLMQILLTGKIRVKSSDCGKLSQRSP